jgi:hypothetical protein
LGVCQDGLAEPFALEIALLATEVIPACAALDEDAFHFFAERLRACTILSGDAVAAAKVYILMRPLLAEERDRPPTDQLASFFEGAEIGGGQAGAGASVSAEQAWLQAIAGDGRTEFVVERVHAPSAGHAVVDGLLRRRHLLGIEEDYPRFRVEEAAVKLVWASDRSSNFAIERLTVGAYRPVPDRCHPPSPSSRAVDC